jgi:hypothetical protein
MRYSSNIFLLTILFTILSFNVNASQDTLLMENYIKQKLFCENTQQELEMTYIHTHYYELTRTRVIDTPPSSFLDIAKSGIKMAEEFKVVFESAMKRFTLKYLNIEHYVANFREEKFNLYNNVVMGSLRSMNLLSKRFTDWKTVEERSEMIVSNIFTSTISQHRELIEEFKQLQTLYAQFKKNIPLIQGKLEVDTVQMFEQMKTDTIDYLSLIFLAAFEHDSQGVFSSQDSILELYWENFYDWLEVPGCERLVNGALNGALGSIQNQDSLRDFMHNDQDSRHLDEIKLVGDLNAVAAMGQSVADVASRLNGMSSWSFFTSENLSTASTFNSDIETTNKVEFDIFRLTERGHCLDSIQHFHNFLDMKVIFKNKLKYTASLEYYYMIEYLWKVINDESTLDEFPDQNIRRKAIQIIYLFVTNIWLKNREELDNFDSFGKRFSYIIISILTGMGNDEELKFTIIPDILDEETELYIYKLFIFMTEKLDLPKPDESDELNKGKKKKVVEDNDEDPHVRINPQNPRFKKVIDRFFVFASKPADKVEPWVRRFRKVYYNELLITNNKMFEYDPKFFALEKKMAKDFENTYDFEATRLEYIELQKEYLTLVKGLDSKGNQKPTNDSINALAKYYINEINTWFKTKKAEGKAPNRAQLQEYVDEILLSYFGKLQSNMIENEYFKTITLCVSKLSAYKLKQPDFRSLVRQQIDVTDRVSLFEYMKRILTYIKHSKKDSTQKLVDTIDINTHHFQDASGIQNGERFRTLLLDVVEFFEPELRILENQNLDVDGGQISFGDLEDTIQKIKSTILPNDPEDAENLENFRIMMKWNMFDDINEYLPLTSKFLDDTKSMDSVGHPLKMRLLVENYTNLYFIMIEHRIFCADNKFSFEGTGEDRLNNLLAYLKWRNSQYENMLANNLPEKEVRFSALNVREVQNLIYFLTFRMKKIAKPEVSQEIKMTSQFFPYSFREIYLLSSSHPELVSIIDSECSEIFSALVNEKKLRLQDVTKGNVAETFSGQENFQFCVLYRFNIDMISLVESRGEQNKELSGYQMTITREDIFNDLIGPYFDKISPLHMLIQVFNLNMSHSSVAASQSAATFSSYITLLDYFFQIIDDLKDGVNDSLNLKNLKTSTVSELLVNFCKAIDNDSGDEHTQNQLVFLRSVLLERLKPSFLLRGRNLKTIFHEYTKTNPEQGVSQFVSKLSYGEGNNGTYNYMPEGDIMDFRLLSLLMIYAPHSEFTVRVLHSKNLMSNLPKLIMNAKDNEAFIYRDFETEENMDQVYDTCFKWMMKEIKKTTSLVNKETEQDFETEEEFELDLDGLEDEFYDEELNAEFVEHEVIVPLDTMDSNVVADNKTQQVLINVIEKTRDVLVEEGEEDDLQPIINNHFINKSSELNEDDQILMEMTESLSRQDSENFVGLHIQDSREKGSVLDLENKNISQKIDSQNNKHITISQKNESVSRQIVDQIETHSVKQNAQFEIHFKSTVLSGDKPEALMEAQRKLMQKLTAQSVQRLIKDKLNGNAGEVKVLNVQSTSHRISMDSKSRLEESVQLFNEFNKDAHISGTKQNQIVYSSDGIQVDRVMRSSKDNQIYSNAIIGGMKNQFQKMVNDQMQKLSVKSKSFNASSGTSNMGLGEIKRKKTSHSTKFIRLV